MANLYPAGNRVAHALTGSARAAGPGMTSRIKVHTTHGNRMIIANTAVVAVRPTPGIVEGQLYAAGRGGCPSLGCAERDGAGRLLGRPDRHDRTRPAAAAAVAAHTAVKSERPQRGAAPWTWDGPQTSLGTSC